MAELKRSYNIPLRRQFLKVPKYRRAKKSVSAVKEFLKKHMKAADVKLGTKLNMKIWEHGIRNPPHHVMVDAVKLETGVVHCELKGFDIQLPKKKENKEEKSLKEKLEETVEKKATKKVVKKSTDKEATKKVVKKAAKKATKKTTKKVVKKAAKKEDSAKAE